MVALWVKGQQVKLIPNSWNAVTGVNICSELCKVTLRKNHFPIPVITIRLY